MLGHRRPTEVALATRAASSTNGVHTLPDLNTADDTRGARDGSLARNVKAPVYCRPTRHGHL